MIKTKIDKYNQRYVEGILTLKIQGYCCEMNWPEKEEVTEEEAEDLLANRLDILAGSNDGSELLANSKAILIKE